MQLLLDHTKGHLRFNLKIHCMLSRQALRLFQNSLYGRLVLPADADYNDVRRFIMVWLIKDQH